MTSMRSKVPEFPKPINPVYKRSVRCASVSTSKKRDESLANCSKTDFHDINCLRVSQINNFSILVLRVMCFCVQLQKM